MEPECKLCGKELELLFKNKFTNKDLIAYRAYKCSDCNLMFTIPNPELDDWSQKEVEENLKRILDMKKEDYWTPDVIKINGEIELE